MPRKRLEKGEWTEGMNEDAFRKYRKNRPQLQPLVRFLAEPPTGVSSSPNLSTIERTYSRSKVPRSQSSDTTTQVLITGRLSTPPKGRSSTGGDNKKEEKKEKERE